MRREIYFGDVDEAPSGIRLTCTRKGIEVHAWYDGGYGGIEGFELTWEQIDDARESLNKKDAKG